MNKSPVFVGIDVSKKSLDVHIHLRKKGFRIKNSSLGINELIVRLEKHDVEHIAIEASGGYQDNVMEKLEEANYKVWLVNAKRIQAFAESEGIKAKSDPIDAKMIAWFAAVKKPRYERVKKPKKLSQLSRRREDLMGMIKQEKNRLSNPSITYTELINKTLIFLEEQLEEITKEMDLIIKSEESLQRKREIIESIPGMGKVGSQILLAELAEAGLIGNKELAALVGVAPFTRQSGEWKGQAKIYGGRKVVRNVLYMSAMVAVRHNSVLKAFYDRLISKGKKAKVALVAVMRKLVVYCNALIRKDELWKKG